jgi:hypothetical protein
MFKVLPQISPAPMDVYQVPPSNNTSKRINPTTTYVVAPQLILTTASVVVPRVPITRRFFRALKGRRKLPIDSVIESKLDQSNSARIVTTLPNLEILEEHLVRPPLHA